MVRRKMRLAYSGDRYFNGKRYEFESQHWSHNAAKNKLKSLRAKGYTARKVYNRTEGSWLIYKGPRRKKSKRR